MQGLTFNPIRMAVKDTVGADSRVVGRWGAGWLAVWLVAYAVQGLSV